MHTLLASSLKTWHYDSTSIQVYGSIPTSLMLCAFVLVSMSYLSSVLPPSTSKTNCNDVQLLYLDVYGRCVDCTTFNKQI